VISMTDSNSMSYLLVMLAYGLVGKQALDSVLLLVREWIGIINKAFLKVR